VRQWRRTKEWIEPQGVAVPESLRAAVGGHPLVAETLVRRGLTKVEEVQAFLDPALYDPAPASDLPGLTTAADRLEEAVRQREIICVWGDFDVDGQTATAVLFSALQDLGALVAHHIPSRRRETRGLDRPALEQLINEGVRLILTCDTGINAHEAVGYAQVRDVDVVVTDHHDLPPSLPSARAIVNPKMLPPGHPLRELPGVGVAYKLVEEIYDRAGRPEEAARYLDLVALGIVADVAVLAGDVRYLLQRGLEVLRRTERAGLQALTELAELDPARLTEDHIGFVLAPRLNALGRLADAGVAVEFLTTRDPARARILAAKLDSLNTRRKLLCDQVEQAVEEQIEHDPSLLEYAALVLNHPSWPAGVIGIVASRLTERHNRPVVLIATPPDKLGRGSARSIEGCNITEALAANREMLVRFGGHPMAAGFAIEPELIPKFRRALSHTVEDMLDKVGEEPALQIDSYLPLADLSLGLVEDLRRLAPFGPGNPPLTLASRNLTLVGHRCVGRGGEHLALTVEDEEGTVQRAIWWRGAGSTLPQGRFDLAYTVRVNDYRGERGVQVEWVDARQVCEPPVPLRKPQMQVVDLRQEADPHGALVQLRGREEVQVWAEAEARAEVAGRDRRELVPSDHLAIWTIPPGPGVLRDVLKKVAPGEVFLFGIDPGLDRLEPFLKRLAGLIKHDLRSGEGQVDISTLAAATAQQETTVRLGIAWLAARGCLAVSGEDGDGTWVAKGDGEARDDMAEVTARLRALLEETSAYRTYFAHADAATLIGDRPERAP